MKTFRSCHLIINSNPTMVIDTSVIVLIGEVLLLHCLNGLHPQTLTFLLAILLVLENW